jgi:ferredoxin-nitrite reductase
LQSTTAICPSLFNATSAEDGILSRIRLPAGLITSTQCEALVQVVNQFSNGDIQITNRANLQIRTSQALTLEVLQYLQDYGLASSEASTDGLRNIMASPTAGIDSYAKINTIPLVKQWNFYLLQPELAILSNKFSVCFDGGETICVSDRPNDICLVAVEINNEIYFDLRLGLGDRGESPSQVGVLIPQQQVLKVLAALTEVYRDYTEQKLSQNYSRSRPPRLRELLHDWGVDTYLRLVSEHLSYSLSPSPLAPLPVSESGTRECGSYKHLGIHSQKQSGLFYIGVVIPLGRLTSQQLKGLGNLAKQYGGGALRLTPWQNILITDIAEANIERVTRKILELGLPISSNHAYAAIAACSGYKGCKAAFTDTQLDAKKVAAHLEKCIQLDHAINIHFSGCDKSCAQHHPSDIALVGIQSKDKNNPESYKVYIGDGDTNFGKELYAEYPAKDLPMLIEKLLQDYQNHRQYPQQTFRESVNH